MGARERRRILLIDDDTSLLVTLSDFLRFEGYDVVTAASGEEGLQKLDAMDPDLIVLDISMPGMGGVGFLKVISAKGQPRYPVLVLTARAQMAEPFAHVNVDGFVVKPCDPADLLAEVNRIVFLRRGHPEAQGAAAGGPRKVLLGEDAEAAAAEIARAIEQSRFEVACVRNGPELLEQAILNLPDVIVIKLALGNMNGDAVAGMLREIPKTSGIPVILYDPGDAAIPAARYEQAGGSIRQFVRNARPEGIRKAVEAVAHEQKAEGERKNG